MQRDDVVSSLQHSARRWLQHAVDRYLQGLAENCRRRAAALDIDQAAELLTQRALIQRNHRRAAAAFLKHLHRSFCNARPYEPGASPPLDRLAKRLAAQQRYTGLCRALSPMAVFAGFNSLSATLQIRPAHSRQAISLFNLLVLKELEQLYALLLEQAAQLENDKTHQWIKHIESQLRDNSLSAERRALAEKRLQHLQRQQFDLDADDSDRNSDGPPLAEVDKVFADAAPPPQGAPGLSSALNDLRTQLYGIALAEHRLFLSPLHPAKRAARQILATLRHWPDADPGSRRQFEAELKNIIATIAAADRPSAAFSRQMPALDHCCQLLFQGLPLGHDDQLEQQTQQGLNRLRREVHARLREKVGGAALPLAMEEMLFGPWTTVILYHWARHGHNSEPAQRCLNFVDELVWYIAPHERWSDLQRAKLMADEIEQELREGLQRIKLSPQSCRQLIEDIHRRRVSSLALRQQLPSSPVPG